MESAQVMVFSGEQKKDLTLSFCGHSVTQPLHSFGPAVRPHFLMHYVLKGKGILKVNRHVFSVGEGEGFLIEPDTLAFYQSDVHEPWEYIWIAFHGDYAGVILNETGLNVRNPVFSYEKKEDLRTIVENILLHKGTGICEELYRTAQLYQFLSLIVSNTPANKNEVVSDNIYVRKAIHFIENNYWDRIRVQDIADFICINRSYLYELFQTHLNTSPVEYLQTFRLTRASELLTTTEYSISQIARSCGYVDAATFSKAFKRVYDVSPNVYRGRL